MKQTHANRYYSIVGTLVRESPKAILVTVQSVHGTASKSSAAMWFPKSQCNDLEIDGADVTFMASEWILGEKGFAKDLELAADGNEYSDNKDHAAEFGSSNELYDSEPPF